MERVAFLIEDTGERIGCLLNPESLVFQRRAGVRTRHLSGGLVAGAGHCDDQVLRAGGGTTELTFNLLFDVSLAGSSVATEDVRDLTGPLWRLAENCTGGGMPPICRFVWGKSWHLPGMVTAVAERFEYFTGEGIPRRSWMRIRFRRVLEPVVAGPPPGRDPRIRAGDMTGGAGSMGGIVENMGNIVESHEVLGGERPDQIAGACCGDPRLDRALMTHNNIDDPLRIPAGTVLDIPLPEVLERLL